MSLDRRTAFFTAFFVAVLIILGLFACIFFDLIPFLGPPSSLEEEILHSTSPGSGKGKTPQTLSDHKNTDSSLPGDSGIASVYDAGIRDTITTEGDQCFCLPGRVVMKNGNPIPPDLRLTCLPKKPPFSLVTLTDMDQREKLVFIEAKALMEAMVLPVATPDLSGSFLLRGLPEERLYLFPLHPYLRPARSVAFRPVPLKRIQEGEAGRAATLVLEACGVIEGVVSLPDGNPSESASVTLMEELNPFIAFTSRRGTYSPFTTPVSEGGRFRIEQVPQGHLLLLEASQPGFAPMRKKAVAVRSGAVTRIDLVLEQASAISGMVVDPAGNPVPDIKVKLIRSELNLDHIRGPECGECRTDKGGRFSFDELEADRYLVRLFEQGYVRSAITNIDLDPGEKIEDLTLILREGKAISGTVTDGAGRAIENARLKATRSFDLTKISEYILDQASPPAVNTDEKGRFRLSGLHEADYDLEITAEGHATGEAKDVEAGTEGLEVVLEKGAMIAGIVISAEDSEAVKRYTIRRSLSMGLGKSILDPFGLKSTSQQTVENEQGKFAISGLAPGTYDLTFRAEGLGKKSIEGLTVGAGEDMRGLIVALPGEASITGKILDLNNRAPIEGVMISMKTGIEGLIEGLRDQTEVAYTDEEGAFRLGGLSAGTVRLIATHSEYEEIPLEEMTLAEGQKIEGIEVYMSRGAGIQGHVFGLGRTPVAGAHIMVNNLTATRFRSARTDEEGFYEVYGLSKGAYSVTKMPQSFSFTDGDFTGSWLSEIQTQSVKLAENEVRVCDFVLGEDEETGTLLAGTVREGGHPVPQAIISLMPASSRGESLQPKTASTDGDGEYAFKGVEPGAYTLRVIKTTEITMGAACEVVFEVKVPDQERYDHDLDLPGGSISGRVRDEEDLEKLENIRILLEKEDPEQKSDAFSRAKGNRLAEVYTDSEGRFRIGNLREGRYRIRAGGSNLFGMNQGGYGVRMEEGISLNEGQHRDGILIELVKGGDLEGKITNPFGAPLGGASIFVQPDDQKAMESFSECITNETGAFAYRGLQPGKCTVVVKHPDYAFKAAYNVWIEKEKVTELNLRLDEGTAVYVQVVGQDGAAVADAAVEFTDPAGRNLFGLTSLADIMDPFLGEGGDEEGQGTCLGRVSAGSYYLKISHPKHGMKSLTVEILPGEKTRILTVEL